MHEFYMLFGFKLFSMSDEAPVVEEPPKRFFIPAMVVAGAAVSVSSGILTLFIVDVASTFHVPV